MRLGYRLLCSGMLGALAACGSKTPTPSLIPGSQEPGAGTAGAGGGSGIPGNQVGQAGTFMLENGETDCQRQTCAELGWACGYLLDHCGQVVNCADEGLSCGANEICQGGLGSPTQCVAGGTADCSVCGAIPDCSSAAQPTRLTGRVVSPGRTDGDTANQIGVPNAIVYILRGTDESVLPAMSAGIPSGGTSCDRCEDQDLGPVLVGGVTDSNGNYTLEGNVPVDQEFVLVVKAGKFRRASKVRIDAAKACDTTNLPTTVPEGNPTRLPRGNSDSGLAIHLPHVAVSTGQIDAMECVLAKMGISTAEFGNPGADGSAAQSIHLYRGGANTGTPPGAGARIDDNTPHASVLYDDLARLQRYDMVVADCEGPSWDDDFSERNADGAKVREYVNRGGRLFASHLSFSWLHQNGSAAYDSASPFLTGLGPAATFSATANTGSDSGTAKIALGRPHASPRIDAFAAWMSREGISSAPNYTFTITQPRDQVTSFDTDTSSEEFVYRVGDSDPTQQFSFNTPYSAPASAACGRVAYSGFHVSGGAGTSPFASSLFPNHCSGDLTAQEKVLLYMLFDLGACVGAPPVPPPCVPIECGITSCGFTPDGCGNVLDCGPCRPPA
jgi:hypothetical protein